MSNSQEQLSEETISLKHHEMMMQMKDDEIRRLQDDVERLVGHKIWIREGVNEHE